MSHHVGVDLGATHVRAVVSGGDGEVLARVRRRTPRGPDGDAVTDAVTDTIRDACTGADVEPTDVARVGVASVGPLDREAGAVVDSPNLPDAVDRVRLVDPVAALVGVDAPSVTLLNDAVAGVLGERAFGNVDADDAVYLTISTGIGAGVVMDGQVRHGHTGNAGEVGHVTIDPDGVMTCGCGSPGHWEAYCSGRNVPRYARSVHDREDLDTDLPLDDPAFGAADVFDAAGSDDLVDAVLDRVAEWNAIGVANVVAAYDPAVVVFGGAVALGNPEHVVDPVRNRIGRRLLSDPPALRLASLGADAPLLGALSVAVDGVTETGDGAT